MGLSKLKLKFSPECVCVLVGAGHMIFVLIDCTNRRDWIVKVNISFIVYPFPVHIFLILTTISWNRKGSYYGQDVWWRNVYGCQLKL